MLLQRFEVPGLAHYSYLLGSQGRAAVIDPERNADRYVECAEANGLEITHILETHIHADYASGATALAAATGAELWLSGHDEGEEFQYAFPHREMRDGDEFALGQFRVVAMHTPGHTPEHLSFLVYEGARSGPPMWMFSGDFLFVGSLGRPDLLGEAAKHELARSLYRSVHERIARLPDGVEVYPAHGSGSLCGSGMAERPQSTLGYERFSNPFMQKRAEGEFVQAILGSLPEFPEYYRHMKAINSEGPPVFETLPGGGAMEPVRFRDELRRSAAVVIDLRRPEAFGGAHIPGAFNIGAGNTLAMWAAWVVPYDVPILLAGDEGVDIEEARRSLVRVGLDDIRGYLEGGMQAWIESGFDLAHVPQVSVRELAERIARSNGAPPFVLDVRSDAEWRSGYIEGATHIRGGDLPKRTGEIPRGVPVYVICGSGYRSSIATSVLERAGAGQLVNVVGGMGAWNEQGLPVVRD